LSLGDGAPTLGDGAPIRVLRQMDKKSPSIKLGAVGRGGRGGRGGGREEGGVLPKQCVWWVLCAPNSYYVVADDKLRQTFPHVGECAEIRPATRVAVRQRDARRDCGLLVDNVLEWTTENH